MPALVSPLSQPSHVRVVVGGGKEAYAKLLGPVSAAGGVHLREPNDGHAWLHHKAMPSMVSPEENEVEEGGSSAETVKSNYTRNEVHAVRSNGGEEGEAAGGRAANTHDGGEHGGGGTGLLLDASKPPAVSPVMVISLGSVMALRQRMLGERQNMEAAPLGLPTAPPPPPPSPLPFAKPHVPSSSLPVSGEHVNGDGVLSAASTVYSFSTRPTPRIRAKHLPPIAQ